MPLFMSAVAWHTRAMAEPTATHRFPVRVYYEDTDMGGIVFYANYLRYIERARSDWVRGRGIDQMQMRDSDGVVFAVRRVEADYHQPARFDEELEVRSTPESVTAARLVMRQEVWRGETLLFSALVTLVALGSSGQPVRLPADIRRAAG